MPVVKSGQPTVSLSLPVPTPVQPKPKSPPVSFGGEGPTQPAQQPDSTGVPPVQPPQRQLRAVILPWSPAPSKPAQRLKRRVVRYSATPTDLAGLFRAARSDLYDNTRHAVIADALDEAYPGNHIAGLIRRQFGFGEHGGQGEQNNLWYEPVENSWDGTFPYAARLGTHGPFDLYLRHEGNAPTQGTNQRWVLHAVSRLKGSRDFRYTFEFPHEEAHLIPRMFPAAAEHINPMEITHRESPAVRQIEADEFNDRMDEEERNRH